MKYDASVLDPPTTSAWEPQPEPDSEPQGARRAPTCLVCGIPFVPRDLPPGVPPQKFCSVQHRKRWSDRHRRPILVVELICPPCGKRFTTLNQHERFCSSECSAAYRQMMSRARLNRSIWRHAKGQGRV